MIKRIFILLLILIIIMPIMIGCKENESYDLVSLTLNQEAEGLFFLGTGTVGEESYFYFYTKEDTGAIKLQKANYYEVTIYLDGAKRAYRAYWGAYLDDHWDLHIPENSIKENYDINLRQK